MLSEEDRLWTIAEEARELQAFILGETTDEVPSKFQPTDSSLRQHDEHIKKLSDLLDMSRELSALRGQDPKKKHDVLEKYVEQLEALTLRPEISGDQLSFCLDGVEYRLVIERRYMIYLYWEDQKSHKQDMMFIGTSTDFSWILRLIEKFMSWLPPEKVSPFQEFEKKVQKVADQFRPEWRELHNREAKKLNHSSRLFLSGRDADEIMNEFKTSMYGPEFLGVIQSGNLEKILAYCTDLASKVPVNKGAISEEMWAGIESDLSSIFASESSESVLSRELVESLTRILGKYTVAQKIENLQAEMQSIQKGIRHRESASPKSVSKVKLIQEAVEKADLSDVTSLVSEVSQTERKEMNGYFSKMTDDFFKHRAEFFSSIMLDSLWLFEEEMARRLISLVLSDIGLFTDLANNPVFDESFRQTIEASLQDTMEDVPDFDIESGASYSQVISQIGEAIYSAHYEKIKKIIDEVLVRDTIAHDM
ncbi:MAG: hypothetical protein AABZ14_02760, partial [Candidatus Margulisiibacteriota bacterium]